MDLATLIKPILTAGQLRVVGSTTHEEFKHIEKDRALARRLQKITIDEPSIPESVRILQGLRSRYEAHHRVRYTDDALEAAAKLAARHLRDYKLPDSAIDLMDEAGAKMRLKVSAKRPSPQEAAAAVVEISPEHMDAAEIDANRARYRNPFLKVLNFRVSTGLGVIAAHDRRHLWQAEQVRQAAGYPPANHTLTR